MENVETDIEDTSTLRQNQSALFSSNACILTNQCKHCSVSSRPVSGVVTLAQKYTANREEDLEQMKIDVRQHQWG